MSLKYTLLGFSVNNFRLFGEYTSFKFEPITLLTGTNSSGKSSLTKALNLLKKSYQSFGLKELDLMQSDLKLGDFVSILNIRPENQEKQEMFFELRVQAGLPGITEMSVYLIRLHYQNWGLRSMSILDEGDELLFMFEKMKIKGTDNWFNVPVARSYVKVPDDVINWKYLKEKFVYLNSSEAELVGDSIKKYIQNNTDCHICKSENYNYWLEEGAGSVDVLQYAISFIKDGLAEIGNSNDRLMEVIDEQTGEVHSFNIKQNISADPTLRDVLENVDISLFEDKLEELKVSNFLNFDVLKSLQPFPVDLLKEILLNIEFIDGIRATQELIYTKDKNPELYDLLNNFYKNKNIGWRLTSILCDTFGISNVPENEFGESLIKIHKEEGLGFMIFIGSDSQISLSSLGYGITQLLPILIKVILSPSAMFVIEEPESNLHPSLQSKLADFFCNATKHGLWGQRFIIETHSEYLIRKMQLLVAKKDIPKEDVQIYYFNKPNPENNRNNGVIDIRVNDDGSLSNDFGSGFFDEADKIALDLFILNKSQKN